MGEVIKTKDTQETIAFRAMHMSTGLDAATCGEMLGVSRGYVYNVLGGSQQPSPRVMRESALLCQDIQGAADGLMSDFRALPEGQSMSVKIHGDAQMVVVGRFLSMLSPEERARVNLSIEK